jgi:hypothetical protein
MGRELPHGGKSISVWMEGFSPEQRRDDADAKRPEESRLSSGQGIQSPKL